MLSPILFSVYTNEVRCSDVLLTLVKFAHEMALVARLRDEQSLSQNGMHADILNAWFVESFLTFNVSKTKELVFDNRKEKGVFRPVTFNQVPVETVTSFKYLGTHIDDKLNFTNNTDVMYKQINSMHSPIEERRKKEKRLFMY